MEQDTKTVTMPLSEFERMREEISNIKLTKELDQSEKEKYEKEIKWLNRVIESKSGSFADLLLEKWDLEEENKGLKKEIEELKNEIYNLKHRKWYQILKR